MNMNMKLNTIYGNWTTRGYANSRIANSRTGQVADWTNRGLADAAKRTKTKHAKSPVVSESCPVRELAIRELAYQRSARCPVTQFIAIAAMFV